MERLSARAVRDRFVQDGFFVARGVFGQSEIAELDAEFDHIVAQLLASQENANAAWSGPQMDRISTSDAVVLHTHNVQQYSAKWMQALFHPRFLEVANAILGPNVVLHHTKLFQKPAENGAPFPVHQDWTYFPTVRDTMLAAIIHVSKADDAMGCLRVYPGSHKLGRIADTSGQIDSDLLADYPLEGATPIEAEPGDVLFFHYFTLHGSMPNRSERVRKTVLVQMHSGTDRVEDGVEHPNEKLVLSGWNQFTTRQTAGEIKS
ncbi:MAG TPA: phytanoyl-CoA dioxygenase family protein [Fimbriimonadales bacterium]|nr:phytanoyl-CoA dioxygenase family protein [Fimbriimonadales bacterium]